MSVRLYTKIDHLKCVFIHSYNRNIATSYIYIYVDIRYMRVYIYIYIYLYIYINTYLRRGGRKPASKQMLRQRFFLCALCSVYLSFSKHSQRPSAFRAAAVPGSQRRSQKRNSIADRRAAKWQKVAPMLPRNLA